MSKRKIISKCILIIYDLGAVLAASFLSLLVRFDLQTDKVPVEYMDMMKKNLWIGMVCTVAVFAVCRLYSTLLSYVGATEFKNIVIACGLSSLLNMGIIMAINAEKTVPLPRSYYVM